jgi:hypothetical protein
MPTVLYDALRESAKRDHRSIAQQAVVTLSRGMKMVENQHERRKVLLEDIKKNLICPHGINLSDAVTLIRKDRER